MNPNNLVEYFHDAFEIIYPKPTLLRRIASAILGRAAIHSLRLRRALLRGDILVNERIVEYPLVWRWIRSKGTVLDFGCATSRLPIQLCSLGYKVHGLDLRPYQFTHINLTFHQMNIFDWQPNERFDIIICISTLEHLGLGAYSERVEEQGDVRAVERLRQWLAPKGQLIVSVPFGLADVMPTYRIYDLAQLKQLFDEFHWQNQAFFRRTTRGWLPCTSNELSLIPSNTIPVNGVAVLNLTTSGVK